MSKKVDLFKSISATKCAICGKDATLTTTKLGNLTARFFSKKCFAKYWKVRRSLKLAIGVCMERRDY